MLAYCSLFSSHVMLFGMLRWSRECRCPTGRETFGGLVCSAKFPWNLTFFSEKYHAAKFYIFLWFFPRNILCPRNQATTRITSGQSNSTYGRIDAAHGQFSRIRQVTTMCISCIEAKTSCHGSVPRCKVSAISANCRPTTQTPLHNQLPSRYRSHKAS